MSSSSTRGFPCRWDALNRVPGSGLLAFTVGPRPVARNQTTTARREWPGRAGLCVRSGLPLRSVKMQKQCAKSNIPNSTRLLSTVSVSVIVYMLPHTTRHTYKRIYDRTGYPAHPDIHSKVIVKIRFRVSQRRPAFGLIPEVPSEVYAI